MIKTNSLSIFAAVLSLCLSNAVFAKQPDNPGNIGPDARQLNSNKQLKQGDNVQGRERADERHDLKPSDNARRFGSADDYRRQNHEHRSNKGSAADRKIPDTRTKNR